MEEREEFDYYRLSSQVKIISIGLMKYIVLWNIQPQLKDLY